MNYFSKRTVIDIYDWSGNTIHNAYVITYQCGKRVFEKKADQLKGLVDKNVLAKSNRAREVYN